MAIEIFVNLPVKDLAASVAFFSKLDFRFNPRFTDKSGTCMIVGENIFVMLLSEPVFKTFTRKKLCDATKTTEVIIALSADSRGKVDELANKAIKAGATKYNDPQDQGFMYQRSFQDLDGHLWELIHLDPTAMREGV